ncbi:hypothetical protein K502DRAFT_328271 [Neoconidiobolus thromboides FSU 785]|nr:hypothetical protein K502DRAFT_328271 [Neoconidiobolus thromboides FSU 785]
MSKELEIINYLFTNNKINKVKIKRECNSQLKLEIRKLEHRVKELEAQVFNIFNLVEALGSFIDNNLFQLCPKSFFQHKNTVLELKKYLKWVAKMFKYKNLDNSEDQAYLDECSIKMKTNLFLIEEYIGSQFFEFSNFTNLRNRAGRGAEHVGTLPTIFDYGSFLEISIQLHDCFAYGYGIHFKPNELIPYIKQLKPNFISRVLITSLSFGYSFLPGCEFEEIYHTCLNSMVPLISEACDNSSFESLKALCLLYDVSLVQGNHSLSHRILSSIVRMSYILGIDKLRIDEIDSKSKSGDNPIIKLKNLWSWIVISCKINEVFYDTLPLIREYDLSESEPIYYLNINQLDKTDNEIKDCKEVFSVHTIQEGLMLSLIFDHLVKNTKGINDMSCVPYSKSILPGDKFNLIQGYFSEYQRSSSKSLAAIINNSNKAINLDHHLCSFPNNYCCTFKTIHEITKSLSIYIYQLFIMYPTMIKVPSQVDIPLSYVPTLLESSLKTILIFRALTFVYFKELVEKMDSNNLQNQQVFRAITNYLENRSDPIIKDNKSIYLTTTRLVGFKYPIFAANTLLQVLSSPYILTSGLISNEVIHTIETNIIELLEIYKLITKLTRDNDRMDIDYALTRLKSAINSSELPRSYKTAFNDVLC